VEVETGNANKEKLGAEDALALARAASVVIVARGKKTLRFEMKREPPDDDELLSVMLGRSGTLRAPTLRRGKTLVVGYSGASYESLLAR
jgi:hypothetical protein